MLDFELGLFGPPSATFILRTDNMRADRGFSLRIIAEAFTGIAKPKCHDIQYSPVKLKFVVFIITS